MGRCIKIIKVKILSINNQKDDSFLFKHDIFFNTIFVDDELIPNLWSICWCLIFGCGSIVCEMAAISVSAPESVQYGHLWLIDWLIDYNWFFGLQKKFAKVPLTKKIFSLRMFFSMPWYFHQFVSNWLLCRLLWIQASYLAVLIFIKILAHIRCVESFSRLLNV